MKFRLYFIWLFFVFFEVSLFSQEDDFVRGALVDAITDEPIAFATIRLKSKAIGIISNQDGGFRIPERFKDLGEILMISCLGYETKELRFANLSLNTYNTIRLKPKPLELRETVLLAKRKKPPSPRKIIKRAIERIPQNYPFEPFFYVGYYRDYQLKEKKYLNLNEALLSVIDMGFQKNDFEHTVVQIYDYKPNLDFKRDSIADNPYDYSTKKKVIQNAFLHRFGGNEFNILRIHDPIRNYDINTFSFVNTLDKDLLRNHRFFREGDSELDGERMYVVSLENIQPYNDGDSSYQNDRKVDFKSVYQLDDPIDFEDNLVFKAEGTFYISQSTYAIHKLDYKLYKSNEGKVGNSKIGKTDNLIFEISLEYRSIEGNMYLNYISFHNVFKLSKSYFQVKEVILDLDQKCFEIRVNKPPIFLANSGEPNIKLKYRNRKISLKKIINTENGILVYPEENNFEKIASDYEEIVGNRGANSETFQLFMEDFFEFEFFNIQDSEGNLLNDFVFEDYHQFREFFTQQLIKDSLSIPPFEAIMKKNRPIFENQPTIRSKEFQDFWMNTPLKKIPKE